MPGGQCGQIVVRRPPSHAVVPADRLARLRQCLELTQSLLNDGRASSRESLQWHQAQQDGESQLLSGITSRLRGCLVSLEENSETMASNRPREETLAIEDKPGHTPTLSKVVALWKAHLETLPNMGCLGLAAEFKRWASVTPEASGCNFHTANHYLCTQEAALDLSTTPTSTGVHTPRSADLDSISESGLPARPMSSRVLQFELLLMNEQRKTQEQQARISQLERQLRRAAPAMAAAAAGAPDGKALTPAPKRRPRWSVCPGASSSSSKSLTDSWPRAEAPRCLFKQEAPGWPQASSSSAGLAEQGLDVPSAAFEVRLPFFIAQCKAFQIAKLPWSASRPCCLANRFLEEARPPEGDGSSCYERLMGEQRRRFREFVEAAAEGEDGEDGEGPAERHFQKLLHPEEHAMFPKKGSERSGIPLVRLRRRRAVLADGSQGQKRAWEQGGSGSEGLQKTRDYICRKRTSGVHGISWCQRGHAWRVSWNKDGQRKSKAFRISMYGSIDSEDASYKALREATAFRLALNAAEHRGPRQPESAPPPAAKKPKRSAAVATDHCAAAKPAGMGKRTQKAFRCHVCNASHDGKHHKKMCLCCIKEMRRLHYTSFKKLVKQPDLLDKVRCASLVRRRTLV